MWKKFELDCKRQLHGQKIQGKGNMNGRRHALTTWSDIGSWKF
jgi:hypothetical protein